MSGENAWPGNPAREPPAKRVGEDCDTSKLVAITLRTLSDNALPIAGLRMSILRAHPEYESILSDQGKFQALILDEMKGQGLLDPEAYDIGVAMRPSEHYGTDPSVIISKVKEEKGLPQKYG